MITFIIFTAIITFITLILCIYLSFESCSLRKDLEKYINDNYIPTQLNHYCVCSREGIEVKNNEKLVCISGNTYIIKELTKC